MQPDKFSRAPASTKPETDDDLEVLLLTGPTNCCTVGPILWSHLPAIAIVSQYHIARLCFKMMLVFSSRIK